MGPFAHPPHSRISHFSSEEEGREEKREAGGRESVGIHVWEEGRSERKRGSNASSNFSGLL